MSKSEPFKYVFWNTKYHSMSMHYQHAKRGMDARGHVVLVQPDREISFIKTPIGGILKTNDEDLASWMRAQPQFGDYISELTPEGYDKAMGGGVESGDNLTQGPAGTLEGPRKEVPPAVPADAPPDQPRSASVAGLGRKK